MTEHKLNVPPKSWRRYVLLFEEAAIYHMISSEVLINKEKYLKINVSIMNFINYHTDAKRGHRNKTIKSAKSFQIPARLVFAPEQTIFLINIWCDNGY